MSEKALSILNKIATFERSKHLTEQQKAQLIQPLKRQLDEITGQHSLDMPPGGAESRLEEGEAPGTAPGKGRK